MMTLPPTMMSLLTVTSLLAPYQAQSGTASCVLVSRGPAQVRHDESLKTLPLIISPCSGISVVSGDVAVCFINQQGAKTCKPVPVGKSVVDVIGGTIEPSTGSVTLALVRLLQGDSGTRMGSSRSIGQFEGLPEGQLLLPARTLNLALADDRLKTARTLAVVADDDSKDLVIELPVSHGRVSVPTSKLARGQRYKWQVTTAAAIYSGRFSVAGAEADTDLRIAQRLYADQSVSRTVRDALLVELYSDRGYDFERDLLLQEFARQ